MAWFKVDDGFADHPKTLRCSLAAVGLWAKAGAWCSKHLTDGAIPSPALLALGGTTKLASELVAAGLWVKTSDGYAFHEWLDHQPSRNEVTAKRDAARERMQKIRGNGSRSSPPVRANTPRTFATPVPSRPDPDPDPEGERASAPEPPRPFQDPEPSEHDRPPQQRAVLAFDRRLWAEWAAALKLESAGSADHDALARCKPGLPSDPVLAMQVFRAAADAYVAARKTAGKRPVFAFFAKDFTDWLAASQEPQRTPSSDSSRPELERYVPFRERGPELLGVTPEPAAASQKLTTPRKPNGHGGPS